MPYHTIKDLPASVQAVLPTHAQEIYLAAFNQAWEKFKQTTLVEETCHRIAWSAVKKKYEKKGKHWVKKE